MLKLALSTTRLKLAAEIGRAHESDEMSYAARRSDHGESRGDQHRMGEDADELIGRVDGALYEAKSLGRHGWRTRY